MSYLLSIVIPTRNRQIYAVGAVKQIYAVTDERVQIVVQDNSDDNSLENMLQELKLGDRVCYTYTAERIPGVDNYANGISASNGEYVCCIGDDDGVMRYIVDVVEWAKKNNIEAIKPGTQAIYFWPGVNEQYNGTLFLYRCDSSIHYAMPQKNIEHLVENGGQGYLGMDLVKAYHGIVRRELFEKIREQTGKYCGGLSPDMYFCTGLSLFTEKILCLNMPLTIGGVCRQSTSGDSANKINYGPLESAPHFVGQPYEWAEKVPRYYCGETIWADTMLHALADLKKEQLIKRFGVEALTAYCLEKKHGYDSCVMENFDLNNGDKQKLKYYKKNIKTQKIVGRIKGIILKIMNSLHLRDGVCRQENVEDIVRAEQVYSEKLEDIYNQLILKLL